MSDMESLPGTRRQTHEPFEYTKHLLTDGSENSCTVAFYELPPRKSNYPYHYHTNVTEVFYIIRGSGIIKTPEGDKPIRAGDVIVCPPFETGAHRITNDSETETLVYLDVDTASDTDLAFYPDSGKVGVLARNHYTGFFKKADTVDYYDGE
ncbi:MAG: cupin domain-containing protein [Clostridiales bacterium]|nr:cupin domain-containing protein [Clostridiales bacterium]